MIMLGGLYVLGLGVLYGIPALLLHLIEDFQLILADLHTTTISIDAMMADLNASWSWVTFMNVSRWNGRAPIRKKKAYMGMSRI